MIQVIKRVIRVGNNGIVRIEVTLSNTRTGGEVVLVTKRPDLDPAEWAEGMVQEPAGREDEV